MIINIFKKYSEKSKKKKIVKTIIENLNINDKQKSLYLDALENIDEIWLEKLYISLQEFIWNIEQKEIEDIRKNNFTKIEWLRKKEVLEKQKDINSFWFLLNNL